MAVEAINRRTFNQILAASLAATALPAGQVSAQAKRRKRRQDDRRRAEWAR